MKLIACISCEKVFKGTGETGEVCPYCDSENVVPHDNMSTLPEEEFDYELEFSKDEYRRSKYEN